MPFDTADTSGLAETGPTVMRTTRADIVRMYAHALDARPNEACGLFGGNGGVIDEVYLLANAEASPYNYSIDSRDQIRTLRDAESKGNEVVGCFHSHTRTDAYPSETDVRRAFYPEWIYALVSLKYEEPVLRAYRIVEGEISEIPVSVER